MRLGKVTHKLARTLTHISKTEKEKEKKRPIENEPQKKN